MLVQGNPQNRSYRYPISIPPDLPTPPGSIENLGSRIHYVRGFEICGEGERAEYLYKVLSGSVRTYNVLVDGRRQVRDFHFAGDFFGLEADGQHMLSAEAVTDSTILVIKRTSVIALADAIKRLPNVFGR